ncbi:MAG: alpha/beta fold hydrolase, partial [Pseudomonadota bacterium]
MRKPQSDLRISVHAYQPRMKESADDVAQLSEATRAGLAAYSLERIMGYGVDYADAVEFRALILSGLEWKTAALRLADRCLAKGFPTVATRITRLRRAAALLRIGQTMMFEDTPERVEIYQRATEYYKHAAELAGNCEHLCLDTPNGPICGWLHPARGDAIAAVIVLGGVEGWAQDFSTIGDELAARGVDAIMLDAPGQGETRFAHQHYLSTDWRRSLTPAVNYLQERSPSLPLGIVGNSMGGSLAMALANDEERFAACVNSSGPFAPWLAPQDSPVFKKMMTMANAPTAEAAVEIFSTITPVNPGINSHYKFLLMQGQ